jgi:hypothetical protein
VAVSQISLFKASAADFLEVDIGAEVIMHLADYDSTVITMRL